ncbi:WD40-like Beta Propeller Repeat [Pseudarthrobacter enclensis]|uniref:Biopolymer transporter Tol n=1 Tax=Pseudarthrobacter enclensis TaxID=993070 RepID=A0A0V8IMK0_9MICC|nr:PD40 domain-containing protein [Pseudarthrobacter enclensis]KSU76028.1 biopolymer transporter Tol [Pseudarthrobacter enclensis]SCC10384.1 WD40-like Beta Propeller Repeat [Pseudarthrobacter enclensis]
MIRTLRPGQRCEVRIASVTGGSTLLFSTGDLLLEAPNWTQDGSALILNGDGKLWSLDIATAELAEIPLAGIPELNNDHVLAPDGDTIFLSANDGHIYLAPLAGGTARQVTQEDGTFHFLHGVSPDGTELAYVGIEAGDFSRPGRLMTMASDGGAAAAHEVRGHCDGPEYSPDGRWLYFNTEAFTDAPGHAQLARMSRTGNEPPERLQDSDTVDWFPHLSPDGRLATYLRFPAGTEGHPADLPVAVVLVSTADWPQPLHTWPLSGGQGTLNVNSWSPDSGRFAYVAYPFPDPQRTDP